MSQENLQTMIMQNFGGVKEVYYRILQVVNCLQLSFKISKLPYWIALPVYSKTKTEAPKCCSCNFYYEFIN